MLISVSLVKTWPLDKTTECRQVFLCQSNMTLATLKSSKGHQMPIHSFMSSNDVSVQSEPGHWLRKFSFEVQLTNARKKVTISSSIDQ